jgi:hypothetical protein
MGAAQARTRCPITARKTAKIPTRDRERIPRPSKLTPELAERLVGLLAGGATVTAAAAELRMDRRTIQHWGARA